MQMKSGKSAWESREYACNDAHEQVAAMMQNVEMVMKMLRNDENNVKTRALQCSEKFMMLWEVQKLLMGVRSSKCKLSKWCSSCKGVV